jgi:hypothetical protein
VPEEILELWTEIFSASLLSRNLISLLGTFASRSVLFAALLTSVLQGPILLLRKWWQNYHTEKKSFLSIFLLRQLMLRTLPLP